MPMSMPNLIQSPRLRNNLRALQTRLATSTRRRRKGTPGALPGLPLEIELLIIDQFAGDARALRELCRVCRAWAAHAQSLLFHDVCVRRTTCTRFLALLEGSTNMGRHIKTLRITEGEYSRRDGPNYHQTPLLAIGEVLAEKIPNVRTLDVSSKVFNVLDLGMAPSEARWGGISRLQLRFCRFATTNVLIAFIAEFSRLESLDIFHCFTKDGPAHLNPTAKPSMMPTWHLKYLALGAFPKTGLIDWMVSQPAELAVDHLRVLSWGPDASSFNALFEKIGGGLRHLELPGTHRCFGANEVPISISACTTLRQLTFTERSTYDLGRGVMSVLAQVASPHLSSVSFQMFLSMNAGYRDIPWEELEELLTTDRFDNLEAVVFDMWGMTLGEYKEAVRLMKSRLVILEARGTLHFAYVDEEERKVYVPPRRRQPEDTFVQRLSRRFSSWRGRDDRIVEIRTVI
ncbi:hypothetical protein B0H11DRAFT_80219 [Mycena galericulata]|nr:hypothetical protein B0H11DRAFT_80219 [Mycena galericulata]